MVLPPSSSSAPPSWADGCADDRWEHRVRAARSQGPPSWTTAAFHVASSLSPGKEGGAFFYPRAAPESLLRVAPPSSGARLGEGLCGHPVLHAPLFQMCSSRMGPLCPWGTITTLNIEIQPRQHKKGSWLSPASNSPTPPHRGTSGCR